MPTRTASPSRAASRGRLATLLLWTVQFALAAMFLMAGGMKLSGAPEMVATFDQLSGQWFRYVTGLIEVGAALALVMPPTAVFGALLLVPTMLGAIAAHLFVIGGSSTAPTVLLVGALVVVFARRHELTAALARRGD